MGAQQRRGVGRLMFGRKVPAPVREGLVIGPVDRVHGTVAAQAVTIAGQFDGRLMVETSLAVLSTGRLTGTFVSERLKIQAGAVVRASVRVGMPVEEDVIVFPEAQVETPQERLAPPKRERDRSRADTPPLGSGLGW
jgi:hypothetical protein